ncbi:MASE1 domain-containing protein, partial [Sphingomonas bacterium]|uniref:MASE1 domain-containing protein n=1 Tax=Sphingomonas bacterium TaxID=1895847 RepID=UPI001576F89D
MTIFPARIPGRATGPLITGAAFYVAAAGALMLTRGIDGLAALWPANGILLAALIIVAPRNAWKHIAAAGIASFLANLGAGVGVVASAGYTLANIVEALIAWRLAQGRDRSLPSFLTPAAVARFFLAAWVAALVSATLAAIFTLSNALASWSSWVTTDLLGMLIVTPVIVTGYAALGARARAAARPVETATLLFGVGAITAFSFTQSSYPLTFLPLAALLVATLRLGPFGAAAGVAIIAAICSCCSSFGLGLLGSFHHGGAKLPVMFLQFYLFVLLATSLPLAALLAVRDRLMRQLGESNRLLRLAERSAGLGHWRVGTAGRASYCSPEVLRIHGLTADQALP